MLGMSHSTVLVIGEDPEAMLEPFNENTQVEAYPDYDKAERPQDFWYFKKAVEEDGLDPQVAWPEFIEFLNGKWGRGDPYLYDPERDRMYQMSTYNPQSKWDWYSLGGRWTGFFKLKDGAEGVDQARKQDIDLTGMQAQAEAEAVSLHAQVRASLAGLPPLVRWQSIRECYPDAIELARTAYAAQPGIVALKESHHLPFMDDPIDVYHLDAEDPLTSYVNQKRRDRLLTFAILDKDGWHERGDMGWFGMVSDEKDDWPEIATRIMDEAPELSLFSVYDVHI